MTSRRKIGEGGASSYRLVRAVDEELQQMLAVSPIDAETGEHTRGAAAMTGRLPLPGVCHLLSPISPPDGENDQ